MKAKKFLRYLFHTQKSNALHLYDHQIIGTSYSVVVLKIAVTTLKTEKKWLYYILVKTN